MGHVDSKIPKSLIQGEIRWENRAELPISNPAQARLLNNISLPDKKHYS
jgi:hypothetical protein